MGACRGVFTVAGAIEPEPLTSFIFDAEIVSNGDRFCVSFPPFTENAFGSVCAAHPPAHTSPGEGHRWLVRQQRHRFDGLGKLQ